MLEKFGDKIPVLSSTGNNDYTPDHQTSPKDLSYLIKVDQLYVNEKKLTFISLNNIVSDNMNLYLFGDQTYAVYQLQLLEQ